MMININTKRQYGQVDDLARIFFPWIRILSLIFYLLYSIYFEYFFYFFLYGNSQIDYRSDAVKWIAIVYFSSFLISGIVFYTIYINSIISVIFLMTFFCSIRCHASRISEIDKGWSISLIFIWIFVIRFKKVLSYPNDYDQYEFQQLHEENNKENVPNKPTSQTTSYKYNLLFVVVVIARETKVD